MTMNKTVKINIHEVFFSLLSLPSLPCPYPEPNESSPHFGILFHLDPF